jgi:hypothetical protein
MCSCQLFVIHYLFICASYLLFVVNLFCSLFDHLFHCCLLSFLIDPLFYLFFSLIVFGVFFLKTHLPPLRGQHTAKCHPRSKDWQSTVGWGDCWIWTQDCSLQSGVATNEPALLPKWASTAPQMSQHCSPNEPPCCPNEPPLLPKWATTAPQWATTAPQMSHHCSPNEPPLLPKWATTAPQFKKKRTILILNLCSGISIPLPANHHQNESINIIQQTPPTLS